MDTPRRITRLEFLHAIVCSPTVRVTLLVLAGVLVAFVVAAMWPARGILLSVAVFAGLVVLAHAVSYLLASERRRHGLDEESLRTRLHWSYAYRGLLWAGLGVAAGNFIAYGFTGGDPTGGVVAGLVMAAFGAVAHVAWVNRPAN